MEHDEKSEGGDSWFEPADDVLLEEGQVLVTSTKVKVGRTMYLVSGIHSVGRKDQTTSLGPVLILLFLGLSMLMPINLCSYAGAVSFLCGMLLLVRHLVQVGHVVVVGTSSGDRQALTTTDGAFARRVSEAIEQAITRRG